MSYTVPTLVTAHTVSRPTAALPYLTYDAMRVDYFYSNELLTAAATHSAVLQNAHTATLSDHFPLHADFDVAKLVSLRDNDVN